MIKLELKYDHVLPFVQTDEVRIFEREASLHRSNIYNKKGKGSDFLGWTSLAEKISGELTGRILSDAEKIKERSDVVVLVGIGGSYLGARAVIEALRPAFRAGEGNRRSPELVYAGHHLDEDYHKSLLDFLQDKDYSVIVISKSGTTTEPAIAFRLLRTQLENKYGRSGAAERIYAVTDSNKGALKQLATEESYTTYDIPDDVGGRYSVLTPVGLLPIAVAGVDIKALLKGAGNMSKYLRQADGLMDNPAALYAVLRNIPAMI